MAMRARCGPALPGAWGFSAYTAQQAGADAARFSGSSCQWRLRTPGTLEGRDRSQ